MLEIKNHFKIRVKELVGMKKIKIISIAITIFAIIFGISLKVCFSHNKDEQTIAENDVIDEIKKTEIENEEAQTIVEIPVEENIAESNMQNNDIAPQAEDDTEKPKNEFAISSKADSNKSTTSKQNTKSSQISKKSETPATTSKNSKTEQKNTSKTEKPKTETKTDGDKKVAMLYGASINDGGWGASCYQAMCDAAEAYGYETAYTENVDTSEYVSVLTGYADLNYDLIFAPGSEYSDAVKQVAAEYPDVKFCLLNGTFSSDNVVSVMPDVSKSLLYCCSQSGRM